MPYLSSGTSASTVIPAPIVSEESLNANATHDSDFATTRSIIRSITSCSGCENGTLAMELFETATSTGIAAPIVSGESRNSSAAYDSGFATTRSNIRPTTSCSGCKADAVAMELSGTSTSTGTAAPIESGESLNTSVAHGSGFDTTLSTTTSITSCSGCKIGADAVELIYWRPEATTTGLPNALITAVPYTMVSDGYTFTSPSVYVIYTSMVADENCYSGLWSYYSYPNGSHSNGSWSNVSSFSSQAGPIHTRVTRAYAPEALSTGGDCHGTSWTAINYTKLYSPQPDYEVATEAACSDYSFSKGQVTDAGYFLAGEFLLSMPVDLSLVDPLWSTCTPESGYDPPRALSPAVALEPGPTITPDPLTQAKPASSPKDSLPVQTPTPELDAPAESKTPADESGLDPWEASILIGTHTVLVDPFGISFDGASLDPDGSPVTVSGAAAMIQGSSIIVGDAIIHLPSPTADNPTLIAGYTITPLAGAVAIDGETLHAGDPPRTIAGTLVSLDSNDNFALNPTVQALPTPPPTIGPLVEGQTPTIDGQAFEVLFTTTIGGHIITAAPSSVVLQGTSLEPGAPGMTIDSTLISLNKAGSLILGSLTIALGGTSLITQIGDELITAAPTGVQIAGSTLLPGASGWTIDGTSVSLDVMGDVIIGGKTIALDGQSIGMGGLIMAGFGPKGVAASLSSSLSRASGSVGDAGNEVGMFEGRAGRLEAMSTRFWTAAVVVAVVVLA